MKPKSMLVIDQQVLWSSYRLTCSGSSTAARIQRRTQRLLTVLCLLGLATVPLLAQTSGAASSAAVPAQKSLGTINGRAMDPSRSALQGARIELQPTGLTAVSDSEGQFTIRSVPAGSYTLNVTYLGFSAFSIPVQVTGGAVAPVEAILQIGAVSQEVVVRGEREHGEIEALNRELTANTILEVLPVEVILSLPNTNIADALGRLPGVSLERDEGEGKYVQIRGTEPRLSNVTINGVHVSSPERDVRNVKLDVIPASLVESIEVSKTLSANQDGDAIGGSINLVTKSADSVPFYTVSGLYGYTPIVNGRSLTEYDGTISERFGAQKKLGVVFGGSYDYNGRGINNIEPAPGTNDFLDGRGVVPFFSGIHLREYQYRRHRYGFAGGADYRLSNGSSAYVRGLFSEFKDFGDTWNVEDNVGTQTSPTTSLADGNVRLRHLNRTPEQRIFSIAAGEKLNLGKHLLDYQFAVSRETQDGQFPSTYFRTDKNVQFAIDPSNPLIPKFTAVNIPNINDPTLYKFNKTIGAVDPVREFDFEGSVSLARHYLARSHFGSFEVGAKIRSGDKTNKTYEPVYTPGATPILYSQVLGNAPRDPNFYFGNYALPPLSDYKKIQAAFAADPTSLALDSDTTHSRSDPNNYHTVERIYAGYAMNTISFGKARIETGLRIETTQSKFTGYHVTFDSNGGWVSTTPVVGDNLYVNVLPSVNFQYAFTPSTLLRAGYGRAIARPNFSDLPPFAIENDDLTAPQLLVGNPNLKPTTANNFDLLAERYLKPVGLLQAGVFYKDLRGAIFPVQTTITSGKYNGFTQVQPVNGTTAHIFGFEAAYQQLLTFLPGFTNGFGVSANYSHTLSKAVVPLRTDDPALARQGPNNWNLGVTYDKRRLSARFGVTHNDAYIYQYNYQTAAPLGLKGPNGDNYTYAHTQLDLQGSYRIRGGLKFLVSGLNLNNEVFGFYQGSPQYPNQREFYGRTVSFGFRWSSTKE